MKSLFPLVALLSLPVVALAQESPAGVVTNAGSASHFRVGLTEVECVEGKTTTLVPQPGPVKTLLGTTVCRQWRAGQKLIVDPPLNGKKQAVQATRLELVPQHAAHVSGFALIDKVLLPQAGGMITVRADGYPIRLTPETKLSFKAASPHSMDEIGTNQWLRYDGTLRVDGSVLADAAELSPNVIPKREENLRQKTTFDSAAVKEEDRQGGVSRFFLGLNGKRIPAYSNAAMQDRVRAIGEKLVPAYQRVMPTSDATRIPFQFQLVDEKRVRDCLSFPSGIILAPYQIVERLNDAQLAAVLGSCVGEVLEKQALRAFPAYVGMSATNIAGAIGGLFVPGLGLATSVGTGVKQHQIEREQRHSSSRAALGFMQDAGFDLKEAAMAWWIVAADPKKSIETTSMPERSEYIYSLLASEPSTP